MKEKIVKILADYKRVSPDTIKTDVPFTELGLDSLDVAELVMSLEDEFGITIELDESVKTVADMVKLIDEAK